MLRPERQNNGNPDARGHLRLELCGDEGTADTQASGPPASYKEAGSRYPDRKINLDALAPTMFHQPMVSYFVAFPHRTNTDTASETSYKPQAHKHSELTSGHGAARSASRTHR